MKKLIPVLVLGMVSLHVSEVASACSPAPLAYAQQNNLAKVLNTDEFMEALGQVTRLDRSVSIQSIDFSGGVNVNFSNGCRIRAMVQYGSPSHPGLCPEFKGVKTETICL